MAFYPTNLPRVLLYESTHAALVQHYIPAPAPLYYDFISVGGTKNNLSQFTYSKCQIGTKGYNVMNKYDYV